MRHTNPMRYAKWAGACLAAVLCILSAVPAVGAAEAVMEPAFSLGPTLSPLYDPDQIYPISSVYRTLVDRYGRDFFAWPHPVRADIGTMLQDIVNLPEDFIISLVPEAGDLPEDSVRDIAWSAVLAADPIAATDQVWYQSGEAIEFGAIGGQAPAWWVCFFPYPLGATGHTQIGQQPQKSYFVKVSREGVAQDVQITDIRDESPLINPLDRLALHIDGLVQANAKPRYEWTQAEKLDLNYAAMFPHLGSRVVVYGLSGTGDLTPAQAIDAAKAYCLRIGDVDESALHTALGDAGFLIGDMAPGSIRLQQLYPLWRVDCTDPGGTLLFTAHLDAKTGTLVEYSSAMKWP